MTTGIFAAITGETGYLGMLFKSAFIGRATRLGAWCGLPAPRPMTGPSPWVRMSTRPDSKACSRLVHCAYDMKLDQTVVHLGSGTIRRLRLLDAARAVGVRLNHRRLLDVRLSRSRNCTDGANPETELGSPRSESGRPPTGLVDGPGLAGDGPNPPQHLGTPRPARLRGPDTSVHRARGRSWRPPSFPWRASTMPDGPGRGRRSRVRGVPVVANRSGYGSGPASSLRPTLGVAVPAALRSAELLGVPLPVRRTCPRTPPTRPLRRERRSVDRPRRSVPVLRREGPVRCMTGENLTLSP